MDLCVIHSVLTLTPELIDVFSDARQRKCSFDQKVGDVAKVDGNSYDDTEERSKRSGKSSLSRIVLKVYLNDSIWFYKNHYCIMFIQRRYSLCDPFRSRQLQPQPITHRYSHTSAIDDDFMDTVGALKRFEMDRRDRSTIWEQEECPRSQHKEVQTDEMPANSQVTHMKQQKPVGTPIASLRMTNTLLRVAGEADNSEQQEKIQFLEAEIKGLRAVENQLSECLKEKEVYKKVCSPFYCL